MYSTGIATQSRTQDTFERFEYPLIPLISAESSFPGSSEAQREEERAKAENEHEESEPCVREESAEKLAEERQRGFAAGHERGLLEGRQLEREAHATAARAAEDSRTQQAAKLIEQFTQEQQRYLQAAEKEVVKLALAVAARILRREAQMDPLLLTGAVRVALGQLAGATEVRLRVPAGELDLWKDSVALLPNPAVKPYVVAGEGMRLGDCVIETALGSVDLGIRSQLGEIERGFFDSANRRKASAAEPVPAPAAGGAS